MKKIVLATIGALMLLTTAAAFAQDHGEVGVFADYVRLKHADNANFWGVGGRVGFNIHPNVQLEGELSYDFSQSFTSTSTNSGTVTFNTTDLRLLHGFFGPKITTSGPVRVFGFVKGGFLNFGVNHSVGGTILDVPDGDTNGALYPGGGIAFFAGPIGFRVEAGDLMYFDRGANHNLRLTFGPQFRF
jgi:hypothetical protein